MKRADIVYCLTGVAAMVSIAAVCPKPTDSNDCCGSAVAMCLNNCRRYDFVAAKHKDCLGTGGTKDCIAGKGTHGGTQYVYTINLKPGTSECQTCSGTLLSDATAVSEWCRTATDGTNSCPP